LWACIERGPVVSDLGYVVVWWYVQRTGWCGGSTVVLLVREGQKSLFLSHFLLLHCGEDGVAVRGGFALVDGYRAPPVMEAPSSSMERGRKRGIPRGGCFLLSPSPTPSPSSSSYKP
jgi:hypothetical protein